MWHMELQPQFGGLPTEVIVQCPEIRFRPLFCVRADLDGRRNHTFNSSMKVVASSPGKVLPSLIYQSCVYLRWGEHQVPSSWKILFPADSFTSITIFFTGCLVVDFLFSTIVSS